MARFYGILAKKAGQNLNEGTRIVNELPTKGSEKRTNLQAPQGNGPRLSTRSGSQVVRWWPAVGKKRDIPQDILVQVVVYFSQHRVCPHRPGHARAKIVWRHRIFFHKLESIFEVPRLEGYHLPQADWKKDWSWR